MAVDVSLKLLSRRAGLSCAGSLQSAMMAVSSFERSLTEEKLHDAEQRLQKSLQQIVVIDSQIRELEILYKRAQKSKKNASRYNLRLKLSVVSGECDLVTYLQ
jgi:hypothetical protein